MFLFKQCWPFPHKMLRKFETTFMKVSFFMNILTLVLNFISQKCVDIALIFGIPYCKLFVWREYSLFTAFKQRVSYWFGQLFLHISSLWIPCKTSCPFRKPELLRNWWNDYLSDIKTTTIARLPIFMVYQSVHCL